MLGWAQLANVLEVKISCVYNSSSEMVLEYIYWGWWHVCTCMLVASVREACDCYYCNRLRTLAGCTSKNYISSADMYGAWRSTLEDDISRNSSGGQLC